MGWVEPQVTFTVGDICLAWRFLGAIATTYAAACVIWAVIYRITEPRPVDRGGDEMSKPIDKQAVFLAEALVDAARALEKRLLSLWESYTNGYDVDFSTYAAYAETRKVRAAAETILKEMPTTCSECGAVQGTQ